MNLTREQHELATQLVSDFNEGYITDDEALTKLSYYFGMSQEQAENFVVFGTTEVLESK